jgi:hypothetical protein
MIDAKQGVLALGGPVALGAFFGSPFGWQRVVEDGLRLPLLCVGAALLLAPTLYIGVARFRLLASGLREIASAHGRALGRAGLVMLGLLPAAAFIGFSSWDARVMLWAGAFVGAVAGGVAVQVLVQTLTEARAAQAGQVARIYVWHRLLFIGWCGVAFSAVAASFLETL